eukprot:12849645-Heterocapsa_arctica.AAC.1
MSPIEKAAESAVGRSPHPTAIERPAIEPELLVDINWWVALGAGAEEEIRSLSSQDIIDVNGHIRYAPFE